MKHEQLYPATLDSGKRGWRARLQTVYENYEEFVAFAEAYSFQPRFSRAREETLFEIWIRNPVVQGSTDPADHRASDMRDVVAFVSRFGRGMPDARVVFGLETADADAAIDAACDWRDELIGLSMIVEDCRLDPTCVGDAILLVETLGTSRRLDGEIYDASTGARIDGGVWDLADPLTGELPQGMVEHALSDESSAEKYRDVVEDCRMFVKEVGGGTSE